MIKQGKRNAMIELFRLIACVLIVFIHFPIENIYGNYIVVVARFAVPFFLIVSGYFSLKSNEGENIEFAKMHLRKTIKYLIFGTTVCAVANTIICLVKGEFILKWLLEVFDVKKLIVFIVFNRAQWLGTIMYYLFMMVYIYIAYILLNKYKILNVAYYSIPILLVANVLISKYTDHWHWYYSGNFFFTGFPFFLLGNWIKKHRVCLKGIYVFGGIIFGLIISFAEYFFSGDCFVYFGTIILTISIFELCSKYSDLNIPDYIIRFGSEYSVLVFILHCPIGELITAIMDIYGIKLGIAKAFIVLFTTIIVCCVIVNVKNKVKITTRKYK